MRIQIVCPHFEPDVAPTGVVISEVVSGGSLVSRLSAAGRARAEYYAPMSAAAGLIDAWRSL